jgi:hypothetical protein
MTHFPVEDCQGDIYSEHKIANLATAYKGYTKQSGMQKSALRGQHRNMGWLE